MYIRQFDPTIGQGQAVAAQRMPRVTQFRIVTTGRSHRDNCCATCPIGLGVGRDGTASNGIEIQFRIAGHRPGMEYDIVRTRRNAFWERTGGNWRRLQFNPMGTGDDHHDDDECLRPVNGRIFVVDSPGFPGIRLPAPAGMRLRLLNGAITAPNATELVQQMSFAEWVIARNRREGIPWRRISPLVFWHSEVSLRRNAARQWVLNRARSRIGRGSISAQRMRTAPR